MIYIWHYNPTELYHFGVLGMKWGVHKQKYDNYKQKIKNIRSGDQMSRSDAKRLKYRDQPLAARIAKNAIGPVVSIALGDVLSGQMGRYGSMSKENLKKAITKRLVKVAVHTAKNTLLKDAMARSVTGKYDDAGNRTKGSANSRITREDVMERGIKIGEMAAQIGFRVARRSMRQATYQRKTNEARVQRWGKNLFSEKVDNIIWESDDFKTAIIDNR